MVKTHAGCSFTTVIPSLTPPEPETPVSRANPGITPEIGASLTKALTLAGLIEGLDIESLNDERGGGGAATPANNQAEPEPAPLNNSEETHEAPKWEGGPLPEMNGVWCSRSWMNAGDVELLIEESFIRARANNTSLTDGGEIHLMVPNVINLGVVTFNRTGFYRPTRLCHDWTAVVLHQSSEVEALATHENVEISTAFNEFWEFFEEFWENDTLNSAPCADLIFVSANKEQSKEHSRDSLTSRWRCD